MCFFSFEMDKLLQNLQFYRNLHPFAHFLALLLTFSFQLITTGEVKRLPLVINTWAFDQANAAAWQLLTQQPTASALDALIAGLSTCERLQCEGTVGYGGSPDEAGETRLDAMLMDGANMNIGAVAAMREIKDAARVAKYVLEHTRHTLLVGEAATDFAEMMGFKRETLSTPNSKQKWHKWREQNCQPNFWQHVQPDARAYCGPYKPAAISSHYTHSHARVDAQHHDTIGMIVIAANAHIFAGTSTNGATHKIPGRVGDSAIPGAGAYADNEVGAAVATGDGDVMMRFLPSLLAVEALRRGENCEQAAQGAMRRIVRFYPNFQGALVVANREGHYAAACVNLPNFPYSVANEQTKSTKVEYVQCIQ